MNWVIYGPLCEPLLLLLIYSMHLYDSVTAAEFEAGGHMSQAQNLLIK